MLIASGYTSAGQQPPDSVVAIVADTLGLPFVGADDRPSFATYFDIRSTLPCVSGPLPFPPLDPNLPVYAISDEQFLVDQTGGQILSPLPPEYGGVLSAADAATILQAQVAELENFVGQIQASQLSAQSSASRGMTMLEEDDPPVEEGYIYGTNDLWLEVVSGPVTNTTADLVIHPPWNVTNGVYDVFATTSLVPAWWDCVLRCAPGQTNVTVTNLTSPMAFFILGLTNDTDHGGMSDAYEGLLGLDPNNTNDDRSTPLVSISIVDSVAVKQDAGNTATFRITRLGGHMTWPLTVALQLSGTASISVNYSLAPATLTSSNVLATIPAGETEVLVTLAPIDDHVENGTKAATLTLGTDAGWDVDSARASATAWILEQYTRTYTTVPEFQQGVLDGLEAVAAADNGHLQFKTNLPPQFPFINVACSDRGTVARINTTNGMVIGEYLTTPAGLVYTDQTEYKGASPSRTTVDQYGNVWVANRCDNRTISGTNYGSITRIGLIIGGSRFDKVGSNYVPNPQGQYVALSNATYNTCIDRDGDGFIRTSSRLGEILAWSNDAGEDSDGGVSTAQDEAITEYVRVLSTGTRTIAVDKFNDIWVGGHSDNKTHLKVSALLAQPVPNSAFNPGIGGYGGVIDALGNLWSSDKAVSYLLWLSPPTNYPPQPGTNWVERYTPAGSMYGIAADPLHPYIWQTMWAANSVFRWNTNGATDTNGDGTAKMFFHGAASAQGLAVDTNGHVWVAHGKDYSHTVGHLNTNGTLVGVVDLQVGGLFAEYFTNTVLAGRPALTNVESPLDFNSSSNWPGSPVPANSFSARWSGIVAAQVQGDHVFYVSADSGAAFRLTVNGRLLIDNWTQPVTNTFELAGTNWLGTNIAYDVKLEYAHFTDGAQVRLSWLEPGMTKQVIPLVAFQSLTTSGINGATGVSVDAAGKIWAACWDSSTVVRIDPRAGPLVVANGQTNHVGLVDMVVSLGNDSGNEAHPYNYSDMTGFNVRIVNPGLAPLKGYWTVINDSGIAGEWWQQVTWTASLTNGCSVEVYVRANDDRAALANGAFVAVTSNAPVAGVKGRYIEVRLAMTRDDPSKHPLLSDLTLYGASSGFVGSLFLDEVGAYETEDAWFSTDLAGPEPVTYQWYEMPPWTNQWALVPAASGPQLVLTNVDLWDDWTMVSASVSNAAGETVWLGPALLSVYPLSIRIPGTGSSGAAERYPATVNVRGEPTNGLSRVEVTLHGLRHAYPADLDILLVSPSGAKIMLMSDAGGDIGVTNATLVFHPLWQGYAFPPDLGSIPSNLTIDYSTSNYGDIETQLPGAPSEPYSTDLNDLLGTNPNGVWYLYIYDDKAGGTGVLQDSWGLKFFYQ
jgi:hypothetical protein